MANNKTVHHKGGHKHDKEYPDFANCTWDYKTIFYSEKKPAHVSDARWRIELERRKDPKRYYNGVRP